MVIPRTNFPIFGISRISEYPWLHPIKNVGRFVCSLFACYRLKWFTLENRIPQHYYHTKKLYNQLCLRWLAFLAFHSILFSKLLSSFSSPSFLWFSTNLVISRHVRSHWTKRIFQSFFFNSFIPNSPFPSPIENIRKPYGFRVFRG